MHKASLCLAQARQQQPGKCEVECLGKMAFGVNVIPVAQGYFLRTLRGCLTADPTYLLAHIPEIRMGHAERRDPRSRTAWQAAQRIH